MLVRVFAEQDIPIQVALGQYDLGITSRTWVDELLARYPLDSLVPLRPLDLGGERLVLAAPEGVTLGQLAATPGVRVTTSHPNQTTRCLNYLRVPDYRVIEVWGQPAAWPPEDADAAVLSVPLDDAAADAALAREGLSIVAEVQRGSATLVANREALASRGLAEALEPLLALPAGAAGGPGALPRRNGRRDGADGARRATLGRRSSCLPPRTAGRARAATHRRGARLRRAALRGLRRRRDRSPAAYGRRGPRGEGDPPAGHAAGGRARLLRPRADGARLAGGAPRGLPALPGRGAVRPAPQPLPPRRGRAGGRARRDDRRGGRLVAAR